MIYFFAKVKGLVLHLGNNFENYDGEQLERGRRENQASIW
jgi:hypothetical protein